MRYTKVCPIYLVQTLIFQVPVSTTKAQCNSIFLIHFVRLTGREKIKKNLDSN
jgi:hypothetical protein